VGMITVTIDLRREDFFFLVDPEDRAIQDKPITERALRAIESLERIARPSPRRGE
jgi:hypothetical protein